MITIKFPRKPLSLQRKKAIELAKKLNYSENEYDSIAESENIEDFVHLFESIGRWQGVYTFVDGLEIDFSHLYDIWICIKNKIPFTNFKWYNTSKRGWDDQDFRDLPKKIENLSDKNSFFMASDLEDLTNMDLIEVIEYKKKYKVTKIKFIKKIRDISLLVKKIVQNFDNSLVIEIINNLPNQFEIKNKELDDENISEEDSEEPEGKEWEDWYNKDKLNLEIIRLLRKIEENTRK